MLEVPSSLRGGGRGRGRRPTSMLSRASLVRVFSSHVPSTGPPPAPARGGRACAMPDQQQGDHEAVVKKVWSLERVLPTR